MFQSFRPASFALLSGALMLVGSSMAFANPDQTNPRESIAATCQDAGAANCSTVSQDTSVSADQGAAPSATDESTIESNHDARRDRTRDGHGQYSH